MNNPPRILIVEDSIVSAMLMEATINRKQPDFLVRVRKTLKGGFEEFESFTPDLVILDLSLPDSRGPETLSAVTTFADKAKVLVVSGHLDLEPEARKMGADDFMAKGIGENALPFIERINALVLA